VLRQLTACLVIVEEEDYQAHYLWGKGIASSFLCHLSSTAADNLLITLAPIDSLLTPSPGWYDGGRSASVLLINLGRGI